MQIEVSKSELAEALRALGKLICRTAPVEVYRSLRIEGKENKIAFQTVGLDEAITYTLPVEGGEDFSTVVNFDEFRTIVRASRNKSLVFEYESGRFGVDHCMMRTFDIEWPAERVETGDCESTELPRLFIGYLEELAPIVDRNDYRPVLRGIHFCKEGIVATNGKELLHISLSLPIENLTIPFPHTVLATSSNDDGRVVTWCDKEFRYFRFEFGNWRWTGKALCGSYPDWRKVIPEQNKLNRIVTFDVDSAALLAFYHSKTYRELERESSKYWHYSPEQLFAVSGFSRRPDAGKKHGKGHSILMPFRDEILSAWNDRRSAREIAEYLAARGVRTTPQNVWKFIKRHSAS